MTPNRLITLAIHTYDLALSLKSLLEREGIYVELNNVNLAEPTVAAGVRIRIKESDLPKALRIVENIEIFDLPSADTHVSWGKILVPTDFSSYSDKAARLAFILASSLGLQIEMLYSYLAPTVETAPDLTDSYDYQLANMEEMQTVGEESRKLMEKYAEKIRGWIKEGSVPAVKFSTSVKEGIPEEVILEYAREMNPQLIVMGTRGAHKKETELIGSVTAEVLDSCRTPAFTVPENIDIDSLVNLRQVAFVCNLDQQDLIAIDSLYRLFPKLPLEVMLIHIPGKREWSFRNDSVRAEKKGDTATRNLLLYCRNHFPGYKFEARTIEVSHLLDDFSKIMDDTPFQLICVPNKKRTVFARLFNPSLAHKILFRADVPMMVIPV